MRRLRGMMGFALGVAGLVSGCSSGIASSGIASDAITCGTTHTAAGVPVIIKVAKGSVRCHDALMIEQEYATMIRSGQVKGNGGGAPITVHGWICQGYPTPEVLRTGDASECHNGSSEVLAVLPAPSSTSTPAAQVSISPQPG